MAPHRHGTRQQFSSEQRFILESRFDANNKPEDDEIAEIAREVKDTEDRVRTWFANRRQKQRKLEQAEVDDGGQDGSFDWSRSSTRIAAQLGLASGSANKPLLPPDLRLIRGTRGELFLTPLPAPFIDPTSLPPHLAVEAGLFPDGALASPPGVIPALSAATPEDAGAYAAAAAIAAEAAARIAASWAAKHTPGAATQSTAAGAGAAAAVAAPAAPKEAAFVGNGDAAPESGGGAGPGPALGARGDSPERAPPPPRAAAGPASSAEAAPAAAPAITALPEHAAAGAAASSSGGGLPVAGATAMDVDLGSAQATALLQQQAAAVPVAAPLPTYMVQGGGGGAPGAAYHPAAVPVPAPAAAAAATAAAPGFGGAPCPLNASPPYPPDAPVAAPWGPAAGWPPQGSTPGPDAAARGAPPAVGRAAGAPAGQLGPGSSFYGSAPSALGGGRSGGSHWAPQPWGAG